MSILSLRSIAAIAIALVTSSTPLGCRRGDPLEQIRHQQDDAGDFEGSIEPLRKLVAERPDDPEVNYRYGHALVMTERQALASWALRKAMEDPEWTVRAGIELAYSALATSDYNEVVDAVDRVLERDPENTAALIARANAHAYWRKEPEKALADATRVLELDPDSIDALKPRILALLQLRKLDDVGKTIADLGRRLDESDAPEGTRAWYCGTRAMFAEELNDIDGANKRWSECLATYPTSADLVSNAMRFYDEHGQSEHSLELLRTALDKEPGAYVFRTSLARRLRLAGQVAEGDALLLEATRSEGPEVAAVWMDLGRYRRDAGDPAGAAEAMARAVELAPAAGPVSPQYPFEYAEALLLAKQYDRALEVAERLDLPAHQHVIRARVAQERGDPALALREFTESFRLWPDNAVARYYAARAAEDLGDFDRALDEYRAAIRIDAGATDARTRAGALLAGEGKPRFAMQLLRDLGHHALEESGERLSLRTIGQVGDLAQIREVRKAYRRTPAISSAVITAELAEGFAAGGGKPADAVRLVRETRGIDYRDPANADALRALVRLTHQAKERGVPREVRSAVGAHPNEAVFQEILGLALELDGQLEPARAAYQRAIELEPGNARALTGLGRLALASDPAQALDFFDRAAAADPQDAEAKFLAARALIARGARDDAAKRLDALLLKHPIHAEAAALRASLDLDGGVADDRTLERARRAARFGGGPDAVELLARVLAERGESDQAAKAQERAKAMREKDSAAQG
jgi:tetratricopeptide (TPR) repeat protein